LPFCPRAFQSSPSEQVSSMDRVPFFRRAFRSSPSKQMSSMDRAALIALFRSTDGANWKTKGNWNTNAALATWEGVKLNRAGRVVGLSLPNNNLHGIAMSSPRCEFAHTNGLISSERGNICGMKHRLFSGTTRVTRLLVNSLPRLWSIFVHYTQGMGDTLCFALHLYFAHEMSLIVLLSRAGPIPEALGALGELKELVMHNNKLTGEIRRRGKIGSSLGYLLYARAGSIPGELGGLGKVQILRLDVNQLTAGPIPEALGALSELKKLVMHDNKLTGSIPGVLGALGNLEELLLKGNQLTDKR
ncbi:unnamed protein product, partial [Ectocarpus sp. 8 AP-2014]